MLAAQRISKQLGGRTILSDVSLRVEPGEVVGLLGPNGAGKSTLIRILALLLRPGTGQIFIGGVPAHADGGASRRKLGVLLHSPLLYEGLSARENLEFYGSLYGVRDLKHRVAEVLAESDLALHAGDLVRTFSQGMRQRLALARARLHHPTLLLLDEPFSGLDVTSAERLVRQLHRFRSQGGAALIVTHQWDLLASVANRALILSGGRIAGELAPVPSEARWLREQYRKAVGLQ